MRPSLIFVPGYLTDHAISTCAALATFDLFCVSPAMKAVNSWGLVILASDPNLASVAFMSSDFRLALITALRRETIAGGVPAGATTPDNNVATKSAPPSRMVGISGISGLRVPV